MDGTSQLRTKFCVASFYLIMEQISCPSGKQFIRIVPTKERGQHSHPTRSMSHGPGGLRPSPHGSRKSGFHRYRGRRIGDVKRHLQGAFSQCGRFLPEQKLPVIGVGKQGRNDLYDRRDPQALQACQAIKEVLLLNRREPQYRNRDQGSGASDLSRQEVRWKAYAHPAHLSRLF